MQEQWRPVVGWEDRYEVSDHGHVRSVERIVHDVTGRNRHLRSRPIRPWADPVDGRLRIKLKGGGRVQHYKVHTLVLTAFVGPRPDGMECCHNDGDCTNNHLSNLRWDTPSENAFDKVRHGTHAMLIKTRCPRGHRLQHPNLVACRLPNRLCLACQRARSAANTKSRRGIDPAALDAIADEKYARIMERVEPA
jgi:hypothetical protein